ncbi:LacI family DNA-binding transcriptional regulator [Pelagicoccus mobilis]|uniref:LacI family DNA-binding transcriptional regulator n=1 Tax=Pelagicoccus mobilis TaxID=415221 RepID=A0A934S136_9BACT|nr:LacI family DNA-binding transcriptional regulator [Pelagicoccus mobilis]MBK1879074.1 LacI family DNA-binding transcriptional regulator [Pelagicoccus mobilis]
MPEDTNTPTIKSIGDFAKHLGLSRWTVSRILNGHKGFHEETLNRVQSEMKRLNFQPNLMARSLRGAKTGLVGVCMQGMGSPILARKISSIQESLQTRGLRGMIEITSGDAEAERDVINHFLSLNVDGIIMVGSVLRESDPIFERIQEAKVLSVSVDPANPVPIPRVEVDRRMGMGLCLRHLLQKGHKRIVLLGLESDPVYGSKRIEGLKEACKTLEMSWEETFVSLVIDGEKDWSFDYGYALAQNLLQMEDPPRGVIALNDEVAVGAMQAINEWGYAVPGDFSVIGFDNLGVGEWTKPKLTSVAQNVEELVEASISVFERSKELEEGEGPHVSLVQPRMIVRGSS